MTEQLTDEDLEKIGALSAVLMAKAMDECAPKSDQVTASDLALCAMACHAASEQFKRAALEDT